MGTVSLTLPADGETIDAADYNTPLTTLSNEFNGNIDNANIKADAAIAGSKLADSGITNDKMGLTTSTDANGWTIYDYGSFKQYRKRTTYDQSFTSGTAVIINLSATTLPTDMASLGTNFIEATLVQGGTAYTHDWNVEMTTTSTSLSATTITRTSATYTGFIDWVITNV